METSESTAPATTLMVAETHYHGQPSVATGGMKLHAEHFDTDQEHRSEKVAIYPSRAIVAIGTEMSHQHAQHKDRMSQRERKAWSQQDPRCRLERIEAHHAQILAEMEAAARAKADADAHKIREAKDAAAINALLTPAHMDFSSVQLKCASNAEAERLSTGIEAMNVTHATGSSTNLLVSYRTALQQKISPRLHPKWRQLQPPNVFVAEERVELNPHSKSTHQQLRRQLQLPSLRSTPLHAADGQADRTRRFASSAKEARALEMKRLYEFLTALDERCQEIDHTRSNNRRVNSTHKVVQCSTGEKSLCAMTTGLNLPVSAAALRIPSTRSAPLLQPPTASLQADRRVTRRAAHKARDPRRSAWQVASIGKRAAASRLIHNRYLTREQRDEQVGLEQIGT